MSARISARPLAAAATNISLQSPGEIRSLGIQNTHNRGTTIFVPESCKHPIPLILMLHGAGSTGLGVVKMISRHAEQHGVMVVAPESQRSSWDMISGPSFGPDVLYINRVMSHIFENYQVDPAKIAIAGFSDGASYALSLGVANGDLFPYILAFSPGFMTCPVRVGQPKMYVSHGTDDNVLPVDRCGRRVVRSLREDGYEINYKEFDGGHVVPLDIVGEAMEFFLNN